MSASSVLAALKGLAASFTDCALFWPSEAVVPPTDQMTGSPLPFVRAEVSGLGSNLIGLGTNNMGRQDGFLRFHVMGVYGTGLEPTYAIADSLTALYRAANPIGGLQLLEPTPPEEGAQSVDGVYFGISFSVPWTYWH